MYDTTLEFEQRLLQWEGYDADRKADRHDQDELLAFAQSAQTAAGWMWPKLAKALERNGHVKNGKEAAAEVKRCRVHADLGAYPYTPKEFITLWLKLKGYTMKFSGKMLRHGKFTTFDRDHIGKEMKLWASEMKMFNSETIDNALDVWMNIEKERIKSEAAFRLRFDPTIDPGQAELAKFVRMLIAPGETEEETARIYRAAEIAFANFVYRVKNHIRGEMKNSCHMMPILMGKQGDGKSEAIKSFCSPVDGMYHTGTFDSLKDNSMMYQYSVMPVVIFEEMQGADKADISALKGLMTDTERQMREAYARASTRTVISTFIASTNKEITSSIKDPTGNRRLLQMKTRKVNRDEIRNSINYEMIWRSIDEDAIEPPMFANAEDLALIQEIQEEQRVTDLVEDWIAEGDEFNIPWGKATKARKLYDSFDSFLLSAHPGQRHMWSAKSLANALTEQAQAGRIMLKVTRTSNSPSYAIMRPDFLGEPVAADRKVVLLTGYSR